MPACTTANTCFKKVNQTGGGSYPKANSGWALEIALNVETAHAMCPNCKILLVEASSNSLANLGAAVNEAAAPRATVISNSYGGSEYSMETSDQTSYFAHPGVPITASSGDGGYGVEFPAAANTVTAVGGTTLKLNSDSTYQSESAWSGSGSGCSAYVAKPSWQTDSGCSKRTVADVSADADPNTGAAVYDSVRYQGQQGWFQVGGTSLAAPLVASVYALAGNGTTITGSYPYAQASACTTSPPVATAAAATTSVQPAPTTTVPPDSAHPTAPAASSSTRRGAEHPLQMGARRLQPNSQGTRHRSAAATMSCSGS